MLAIILFATSSGAADRDELFDKKAESRIVEWTQEHEKDPLRSKEKAEMILYWWIEAPHVSLTWCAGFLLGEKGDEFSGRIMMQGMFGTGAYILQESPRGSDPVAAHLAGVESALRAYEDVVSKKPKMKRKNLEMIKQIRDENKLEEFVASHIKKKCPEMLEPKGRKKRSN